MKIYTKTGDEGMTSLLNEARVSKTDNRIELLGDIDEVSALIGLAKVCIDDERKAELSTIQEELIKIMAGIADSQNKTYGISESEVSYLEKKIDDMEPVTARNGKFILYGENEVSARLDVARAVVRRAERRFYNVKTQYGADETALRYMNRLSDYLFILARYEDEKQSEK